MGARDACLCLENSAHPAVVDEKNEAHGQYRCVFCADLRRRNRKCGKISEGIVRRDGNGVQRQSGGGDA